MQWQRSEGIIILDAFAFQRCGRCCFIGSSSRFSCSSHGYPLQQRLSPGKHITDDRDNMLPTPASFLCFSRMDESNRFGMVTNFGGNNTLGFPASSTTQASPTTHRSVCFHVCLIWLGLGFMQRCSRLIATKCCSRSIASAQTRNSSPPLLFRSCLDSAKSGL